MQNKSEKQLEQIKDLLVHGLVVQLYSSGCTMGEVAKNLHISKASVVKMLKGVKVTKAKTDEK